MISQSIALLCLAAQCLAQSNQYLPPDKGYSYEPPSVPFPSGPGPSVSQPPAPPVSPQGPPSPSLPPPGPNTPYPPSARPPSGPGPSRPQPGPAPYGPDSHLDMPHVPGMPYEFDYAVNDPAHMAYYSHNANSDGDQVKGEYRVQLPDGRTQIVTYVADWATGFHADVKYEGEATYPAPAPYRPPSGPPAPYPAAGPPSAPAPATAPGPSPGSFPSPPSAPGSFEGYPGGPPSGVTGSGY